MIIYTLLYYTCIFIRCQRIEGDYRTKAAVVMHNPFFTSFTVGRGSFAVINKRSRLAAGRGVGASISGGPRESCECPKPVFVRAFAKKRLCTRSISFMHSHGKRITLHAKRRRRRLISLRDGPGSTDFRRWDSAGLRLPNTASLRRGYR